MNTPEYSFGLISYSEFKEHEKIIPPIDTRWWLCDSDRKDHGACCVYTINSTNYIAYYFYRDDVGVRPAITISNPEQVYKYGSTITVCNYDWTVLRSDENECYALCTTVIGKHRIDPVTNIYEKSEIKLWIEDFFKNKAVSAPETEETIFDQIIALLPRYPHSDIDGNVEEGMFWSDGYAVMCATEKEAKVFFDLLVSLGFESKNIFTEQVDAPYKCFVITLS